jgi:hypothetical protein
MFRMVIKWALIALGALFIIGTVSNLAGANDAATPAVFEAPASADLTPKPTVEATPDPTPNPTVEATPDPTPKPTRHGPRFQRP